jgi:8-oxo-dGTP diphosphatase
VIRSVQRAPVVIGTTTGEFAEFLAAHQANPTADDHLVAIAWVLDESSRQLLLVHHRVQGWSCPGGHVEAGEDPFVAAVRELSEETGVDAAASSPDPVTIGRSIGCARPNGGRHRHWMLGYACTVPNDAGLVGEPGQLARWFPLADLPSPRAVDIDVVVEHIERRGWPLAQMRVARGEERGDG